MSEKVPSPEEISAVVFGGQDHLPPSTPAHGHLWCTSRASITMTILLSVVCFAAVRGWDGRRALELSASGAIAATRSATDLSAGRSALEAARRHGVDLVRAVRAAADRDPALRQQADEILRQIVEAAGE